MNGLRRAIRWATHSPAQHKLRFKTCNLSYDPYIVCLHSHAVCCRLNGLWEAGWNGCERPSQQHAPWPCRSTMDDSTVPFDRDAARVPPSNTPTDDSAAGGAVD